MYCYRSQYSHIIHQIRKPHTNFPQPRLNRLSPRFHLPELSPHLRVQPYVASLQTVKHQQFERHWPSEREEIHHDEQSIELGFRHVGHYCSLVRRSKRRKSRRRVLSRGMVMKEDASTNRAAVFRFQPASHAFAAQDMVAGEFDGRFGIGISIIIKDFHADVTDCHFFLILQVCQIDIRELV